MFWSLTPREIEVHFAAARLRLRREHDERMFAGWHIAAFGRVKRLPKLSEVLSNAPGRPARQSAAEQKAVMRSIFAARKFRKSAAPADDR